MGRHRIRQHALRDLSVRPAPKLRRLSDSCRLPGKLLHFLQNTGNLLLFLTEIKKGKISLPGSLVQTASFRISFLVSSQSVQSSSFVSSAPAISGEPKTHHRVIMVICSSRVK